MEDHSKDKVTAIYELRAAAEEKARAEMAVDASPRSREAQGVLLDAQLNVEAKTHEAIEACHECGHEHEAAAQHVTPSRVSERRDNVLAVDFRPQAERG